MGHIAYCLITYCKILPYCKILRGTYYLTTILNQFLHLRRVSVEPEVSHPIRITETLSSIHLAFKLSIALAKHCSAQYRSKSAILYYIVLQHKILQ